MEVIPFLKAFFLLVLALIKLGYIVGIVLREGGAVAVLVSGTSISL